MNIIKGMEYGDIQKLNKSLIDNGSIMVDENGMRKAFEAGEGTGSDMTDLDTLTGGRAITVENIDRQLKVTAENRKDLKFFNLFRKQPIYAVLDQWMVLSDHGTSADQHAYGKWRDESSFPKTSDTTLERKVDATKFIRDMRDLTQVADTVTMMADKHNIINNAGAITVLKGVELATIFGNSSLISTEFDGLYTKLLAAYNNGFIDAIVDCRATGSDSKSQGGDITEEKMDIGAENIMNNFGAATHFIMPTKVKSDLNKILTVGRRANLPQIQQDAARALLLGVPAAGYASDFAYSGWDDGTDPHFNFVPSIDTFFPSGESNAMKSPTADFPNSVDAPAEPTSVTAAVATDASSKFGAGDAGDYWYTVSAVDADGKSVATAIASAVTVAAGQKVTLTVTCADSTITGLAIYRSVLGAADSTDTRWIADVAVTDPVSTTEVIDLNLILPGCSCAVMVSNAPETDAIDYRQLMPFMRMQLPFGLNGIVGYPYLYMLYCYLRVQKLENTVVGGTFHVLYTNIRWSESTFSAAA